LFQFRRFFWCVWRLFVILEKYLSNRNGGNPFLSDFQIYSTIHLQTLIEIGKVTKHALSWKTKFRILSTFAKFHCVLKKIGNVTMARFSLLQSVKVPTLLYFLLLYWLGIWKDDKWGQLIFQFFMKGDKKKYLLPWKSITSTKLFLYDYIKTFTWIAKNSFCRKYCSNMF